MKRRKFTCIDDDLLPVLGSDACVILAKVEAFCGDGDECQISMQWLADLLGVSYNTIKTLCAKLREYGFINYAGGGAGRGCKTIFKKVSNFDTLKGVLGIKKDAEKVSNFDTMNINKNIIIPPTEVDKNIKKRTHARTLPTTKKEELMKEFAEFWAAFKPEGFDHEKEGCERQWLNMSDELRTDILNNLRGGKCKQRKTRPNPHWFLHDYKPMSPNLLPKGARLTRDQYYEKFGSDEVRPGWRFYKPAGYERYIFERV